MNPILAKGRWIIRAADQLFLRVAFVNLVRTSVGGVTKFVRAAPGAAQIVLYFPPQSMAEQTTAPTFPPELVSGTLLDARIAGWSRITFTLPSSQQEFGADIESLLATCALAGPEGVPDQTSAQYATSLTELPYAVFLAPKIGTRASFTHPPSVPSGWREFWHMGLHTGKAAKSSLFVAGKLSTDTFSGALGFPNRKQIAEATINADIPAIARKARLHSVGGTIQLDAAWPDAVAWAQDVDMARDNLSVVVNTYLIFPLGHRLTVTRTARRFFFGAGNFS